MKVINESKVTKYNKVINNEYSNCDSWIKRS